MFFFGFHGELRQQNGRHTLEGRKLMSRPFRWRTEQQAGWQATQLWFVILITGFSRLQTDLCQDLGLSENRAMYYLSSLFL
jgi:hypothetical protein